MSSTGERFDIPVLMLVFNRPELTERVLKRILEIKPKKIYVVADGARLNRSDDKLKVEQTRAIFSLIPEDVELITLFREENLGCRQSVSNGITWFFSHEEKGIIMEDDCLPDLSFFPFVKELLDRYQENEEVMHISGNNFQDGIIRGNASYYFSIWPHIWGWATWRSRWNKYSSTLTNISEKEFAQIMNIYFPDWTTKQVFRDKYLLLKMGEIDTWDYQWMFTMWKYKSVAILPNVNLVSNIGFGEDALHCRDEDNEFANLPTASIIPLVHTKKIKVDMDADRYTYKKFFYKSLLRVMYRMVRRWYIKNTSKSKVIVE